MFSRQRWQLTLSALWLAALLAGCGGGGGAGSGTGGDNAAPATSALQQEPGAPALTGNTAVDGANWINYRRAQIGIPLLARNGNIDLAAQNHSNYQRANNSVTHDETRGLSGYTGEQLIDRLAYVQYSLVRPYAYGEIISATTDNSGFAQAEELVTAIYHRFVMFEPVFKEVGTGAATAAGSYTYFTADLTASNGYGAGLDPGKVATYPVSGQTNLQANFFSDNESPDPVPGQNQVGYPISVHANITSVLTVQDFSVRPRGGGALAVRLLSHATDPETPQSAAAIIPLAVLKAGTTFDVSFSGMVDGVAVNRNWSFSTR